MDFNYDQTAPPPQESTGGVPWKTLISGIQGLKTDVIENRKKIEEVRTETIGSFDDVWDNITSMREELRLVPYSRKKNRPAPSPSPTGGPTIDPEFRRILTTERGDNLSIHRLFLCFRTLAN
ncbi:hypothetical protein Q3G72_031212 [Acer saccharum]|nr:hypothetical protein Q3G72_031212 [Acer saccharum]